MSVERVDYTITIQNKGDIIITLDDKFKGKLSIKVKGIEDTLAIPVELSEEGVNFLTNKGIDVHKQCVLVVSF